MTARISSLETLSDALVVTWDDGSQSEYPYLWLRDNAPGELHPQTRERTFDLLGVEVDIAPEECAVLGLGRVSAGRVSAGRVSAGRGSAGRGSAGRGSAGRGSAGRGSAGPGSAGPGRDGPGRAGPGRAGPGSDGLRVRWPDKDVALEYPADWLWRHRPGTVRSDPAALERTSWAAEFAGHMARFDAARCETSPGQLLDALIELKRSGVILIENLPDHLDAGKAFGDLIGFKRESNFGVMFDVISKVDPNNLAYTSLALPLHTDLPNQELIPGYQFLHCYRDGASGGESVFADGFQISRDLRREDPEAHQWLSTTPIPYRFHDDTCDIRAHRLCIQYDADGEFDTFAFNAHIADVPDMPASELRGFYAAYRALMRRIRSPRYRIRHKLGRGEMMVFDNRRILHGRAAFDPRSGDRHLRGYYIDRPEIDSRIRVLSRRNPPSTCGPGTWGPGAGDLGQHSTTRRDQQTTTTRDNHDKK